MYELRLLGLLVVTVGLAACGGSSSSGGSTPLQQPNTYTVGGTTSNLAGSGLVLRNNATDSLIVNANGPFTFKTAIANGKKYSVSIAVEPSNPRQSCKVSNGSGTVNGKNITDVSITCVTKTYAVGGTVTGLLGSGLKLQNNGGDDLNIDADGTFMFSTAVTDGTAYDVTIASQPLAPPNQTCTVNNGSGTLSGKNVTNVLVDCVSQAFTVNADVTGLTGTGLVLSNNGVDNLSIPGDGLYPFSQTVNDGSAYNVSVATQPSNPNQACTVSNGNGTINSADITVAVNCVDNIPTTSVSNASVVEGDSGTTNLIFKVSLSVLANGDVTIDYTTSDGTATAGSDYTTTSGALTVFAGTTSNTVSVPVTGDITSEPNEMLSFTLSNVSANAALGTASATGTIFNDDGGFLDDTGITLCSNGGGSPCPSGQEDNDYGRDITANNDSDGHAGFSFVKYGSNGSPLSIQNVAWDGATGSEGAGSQWACVLDQVTQLMWEVKTEDGGLHDRGWTYTWYNSNSASNGGDAGTVGATSSCGGTVVEGCDTEKFLNKVNSIGLCGHNDWRLPTNGELMSLVNYGRQFSGPYIDVNWFPNTMAGGYWSSKPDASTAGNAWDVNFGYGTVNKYVTSNPYHIRLVRGGL